MKPLIIVSFLFIISCSGIKKPVTSYDLANSAIDSMATKIKLASATWEKAQSRDDTAMVTFSLLEAYRYGKTYQMALAQLEPGNERDSVIEKYNREVGKDPEEVFPEVIYYTVYEAIFHGK